MKESKHKGMPTSLLIAGALLLGSLAGPVPALAQAAPVATAPYKISAFAKSSTGVSQPDAMALWNDNVIVRFQNHVAKDGTDGKFSTIVEFSLAGKVKCSFQVQGHNDGLRVVGDNQLWAVQDEDANPNLVVIDLKTGQAKKYKFASDPHGGGYDDIVVKEGQIYMTASNPTLDAMGNNVFPALVRVSLSGDEVLVDRIEWGCQRCRYSYRENREAGSDRPRFTDD